MNKLIQGDLKESSHQELNLIQSMYPDQFQWIQEPIQSANLPQSSSFRLTLESSDSNGQEYTLQITFTISVDYPQLAHPNLAISSNHLTRVDQIQFNEDFKAWISSNSNDRPPIGESCLDILIDKVIDLSHNFTCLSDLNPKNLSCIQSQSVAQTLSLDHLDMAWSVFWMHHIMATGKRKNIISWARELNIRGWSKPGYPGVLIIDGPAKAIEEYSSRLKSLRWKAIQQRHLEYYSIPYNRNSSSELELHRKIKLDVNLEPGIDMAILEVETMSELLRQAKNSGLENLVLEILKIK
ncbi:hypothetical protein O181_073897 [Austropuccinia psidii MF-1]|uniref:RWD domain-containing protein n=1 Tax=Austropuccinia psidii MF-1 TaxID=1389203 RepID=A0A9Q3FC24_9BASI|nr:hypothetical protein [Austropuccinia psidii MF-1]